MSSAALAPPLAVVTEADPYPYGWRVVAQERGDGGMDYVYVPLTREDLLHPEEDDQVTHAEPHERRCVYLYDVFRARVAGTAGVVVLKDVRIAWDRPNLRAHGPDLMVIPNVREVQAWSTFDVATEGTRPTLIVEIASPSTADIDLVTKLRHYDRAGVATYVVVDGTDEDTDEASPLRLFGFERVGDRYRGLAPDAQGRLWLPPVRVWLGIVDDELVCFDEHDQPIGDFTDQLVARQAAEERARVETQARLDAEERIRALEAELQRLRGQTGNG
jgi:Uma2 family endonuclease